MYRNPYTQAPPMYGRTSVPQQRRMAPPNPYMRGYPPPPPPPRPYYPPPRQPAYAMHMPHAPHRPMSPMEKKILLYGAGFIIAAALTLVILKFVVKTLDSCCHSCTGCHCSKHTHCTSCKHPTHSTHPTHGTGN
jgi:hypothetical protein